MWLEGMLLLSEAVTSLGECSGEVEAVVEWALKATNSLLRRSRNEQERVRRAEAVLRARWGGGAWKEGDIIIGIGQQG